jgi:hypothetical protein
MSIVVIVVGIWNGLLLITLAAAIHWRERMLRWITGLDGQNRDLWETGGDDGWKAFLAEHPELIDS